MRNGLKMEVQCQHIPEKGHRAVYGLRAWTLKAPTWFLSSRGEEITSRQLNRDESRLKHAEDVGLDLIPALIASKSVGSKYLCENDVDTPRLEPGDRRAGCRQSIRRPNQGEEWYTFSNLAPIYSLTSLSPHHWSVPREYRILNRAVHRFPVPQPSNPGLTNSVEARPSSCKHQRCLSKRGCPHSPSRSWVAGFRQECGRLCL